MTHQFPYAADDTDGWTTTAANTWTSGFFPGVLWQLYNLTGKPEWREHAHKWTQKLADLQRDWSLQHDFGGWRLWADRELHRGAAAAALSGRGCCTESGSRVASWPSPSQLLATRC
jgi:hypothetical protein